MKVTKVNAAAKPSTSSSSAGSCHRLGTATAAREEMMDGFYHLITTSREFF